MTTRHGHHKEECRCDECCPPKPRPDTEAARRLADELLLEVYVHGGKPQALRDMVTGSIHLIRDLANEVDRLRAELAAAPRRITQPFSIPELEMPMGGESPTGEPGDGW